MCGSRAMRLLGWTLLSWSELCLRGSGRIAAGRQDSSQVVEQGLTSCDLVLIPGGGAILLVHLDGTTGSKSG